MSNQLNKIYCYLSDTALLPIDTVKNSTTYNAFSSNGCGVGQITDRVMSVFNTDINKEDLKDDSPGLLIDPRTQIKSGYLEDQEAENKRLSGLFSCNDASLAVTSLIPNYRAYGQMCLHYDTALDYNESNSISSIDISENELKCLFNVIETCVLTHTYNNSIGGWIYGTSDELEAVLDNYKYSRLGGTYGYVPGSLKISVFNSEINKCARVKLQHTDTRKLTLNNYAESGNSLTVSKNIYFPAYIEFKFLFNQIQGNVVASTPENMKPTVFRIYLDPETLLNQYVPCTIRKIVFPISPDKLLSKDYGSTVAEVITKSSKYVGDTLTHTVSMEPETELLLRENYTGASAVTVDVPSGDNTNIAMTFTCLYKGAAPTKDTMRKAIGDFLDAYAESLGLENIDINSIIPSLQVSGKYYIIPLYDTITNLDIGLYDIDRDGVADEVDGQYRICRNIVPITFIRNKVQRVTPTTEFINASDVLMIPGFNLYAVSIPLDAANGALSSIPAFANYQAISSISDYWDSMSSCEKDLNMYLAAIVSGELNSNDNILRNRNFDVTKEVLSLCGMNCTFYTFTIASGQTSVEFSVLTRESYSDLYGV